MLPRRPAFLTAALALACLVPGARADEPSLLRLEKALRLAQAEATMLQDVPLRNPAAVDHTLTGTRKLGLDAKAKNLMSREDDWIRDENTRYKTSLEVLDRLTEVGFIKIKMPDDDFARMRAFYEEARPSMVLEDGEASYIPVFNQNDDDSYNDGKFTMPASMAYVPPDIVALIQRSLQPMLERWVGAPLGSLVHTSTYGIRSYSAGAVLRRHVDKMSTHVVSAIINVAQDQAHEQWPLTIVDHAGKEHEVYMVPGEMVFYESATCKHGRPYALNGSGYANVFTHYRPRDWKWKDAVITDSGEVQYGSQNTAATIDFNVVFTAPTDPSVLLYWVDGRKEERQVATFTPEHAAEHHNTFIGHVFVARSSGTGAELGRWVVSEGANQATIHSSPAPNQPAKLRFALDYNVQGEVGIFWEGLDGQLTKVADLTSAIRHTVVDSFVGHAFVAKSTASGAGHAQWRWVVSQSAHAWTVQKLPPAGSYKQGEASEHAEL